MKKNIIALHSILKSVDELQRRIAKFNDNNQLSGSVQYDTDYVTSQMRRVKYTLKEMLAHEEKQARFDLNKG